MHDTAERAVEGMPDGPLKIAAFQTILAKLLAESNPGEQVRQAPVKASADRTERPSTLTGRILAIRSEGFFKTQRSLGEVRESLIEAATSGSHPFAAVLVDDTSRLSRKLADSLRIFEQLRFAGVRIGFVSQGIDTDSEQAEVLLATHGIVDSLYIKELAKKIHRGVEGRALQGFRTGGRCFGSRSAPIGDPTRRDTYGRPQITRVRLEIDPDQAIVVRRIFANYAAAIQSRPLLNVSTLNPCLRPTVASVIHLGCRRPFL